MEKAGEISIQELSQIYRKLFLVRHVEERVAHVYPTDKVKSPVHLSIGQEPPSVGVCAALRSQDIVFGTYRGHALYLAKGGSLNAMIAELYGKASGCAKGKGGSMHLADKSVGVMGTSAIVSTTIPQAVGYALAEKMRGTDVVVSVFFGDGATEEGVFWESINFASLKNLPVVFVCENNKYAIHTPISSRVLEPNYCERVAAFGVPSTKVSNNDVLEIYRAAKTAVSNAHTSGPQFLEVETYRWREHVGPGTDWHLGYRTEREVRDWMARDELIRIATFLPKDDVTRIQSEITELVDQAFDFAERSDFPDAEELYSDVYQ